MIKALLILTTMGSCKYYKLYEQKWEGQDRSTGVISYVSAVSLITTEMGEKAPKRIEFGENEIVYDEIGEYIVAIVREKESLQNLVDRIKTGFTRNFISLYTIKQKDGFMEDDTFRKMEGNCLNKFVSHLNLIVNKKTNISDTTKTERKSQLKTEKAALVIDNVDLLITTETGQPVYIMQTLFLPYDAVLLVAFVSAILDIGKQYELGEVTTIESKGVIIYIERIEKAFTVVITKNKEQKSAYIRFAEFISNVCNDWLSRFGEDLEESFAIFEKRAEFESTIRLLIDSETWERHEIKQRERKAIEELGLTI